MSESLGATLAELADVALDLRARIAAERYTLRVRDRAALVRLATALEPDRAVIPTLMVPPFGPTSPGALPADPDTTAPTQPTGLNGAPGSDSINWTWDASADGHDGTAAASGVASYDLELNGAVTSVAAPDANALGLPTLANVGTFSPAPTFARSGNTTTLTTAGTGFDGTADQLAFAYWSTTGNFKLTGKVQSFTGSGGEYAPAGLMVRESTAAGSRYVAVYQWLSAVSKGVQFKHRPTTDGAKVTGSFADGDNAARWLQIDRTGDVFTFRWSTDGGSWNDLGTVTLALSSDVLIGCFASDLQATPAALIATFDQVAVTNSAQPSYYQPSVAAAVTARIRSRDSSGNLSAWAPSITRAPASGTKKWTTGQAIRADAQGYPSKDAQHYATYAKAYGVSNIVACEIPVNWYRTNPSIGVFDFSYVDDHIDIITQGGTNGKKVLLVTQFQNYGGSVPAYPYTDDDATLPGFILQAGYGATRTTGGVMPKLDVTACADYWLAWIAALCEYYDDNPHVVLITVGETSSAYSGMSAANYAATWYRLPEVLKNSAPNTWCAISHNGLTSPSTSIALNELMVANGIGFGVEDAAGFYGSEPAQYGGWGYYAWAGVGVYDDGDGNGAINYGTTDSRLSGPCRAEQQVIRSTTITKAQVNALMNNHWKNSLSVWAVYFNASGVSYRPDYYGTSTPATGWSGDEIIAFLTDPTNAVTRTAYPG